MSLYKAHQKPPILTSNYLLSKYVCSQRAIKRAINLETFFSEKITFKAREKDVFKRNQFSIKNIKLTGNLLKSFVKLKEIEKKFWIEGTRTASEKGKTQWQICQYVSMCLDDFSSFDFFLLFFHSIHTYYIQYIFKPKICRKRLEL